ncbi:MAG: hypothetical protein LCH51_06590 [Bacteroidetes bacterium]|nr:hypothetical protein [Bacteroidota bacterium]
MTTLMNLLVIRISVGLAEIIIFQVGAIVLGFALSLFITSRRNTRLQLQQGEEGVSSQEADEWKLKYFNDTEDLEKKIARLQHELKLARENEQFLALEIDSVRAERQELLDAQAEALTAVPIAGRPAGDYLEQLQEAQNNMLQHNQRMQQLLGQIESMKAVEQKHAELMQSNELLTRQMGDMRIQLLEKDNEIRNLRQQGRLASEMQTRLERVYGDYNELLDKMQKLESHVASNQKEGSSYAELQDSYFKVTKELDDFKMKYLSLLDESQRNARKLAELEDDHREANFQRSQLQKKVTYLEELNRDLQEVAEQHNKLHTQMRRLSEIEQLLSKAGQLGESRQA